MNCRISSINYCPVKSLSFQSINSCQIKKNIGIKNDRIFAFSRIIDSNKAKLYETNPDLRNLNNLLTLKNSPELNKYNFEYNQTNLSMFLNDKKIISINPDFEIERNEICNFISNLENSLIKPIYLLKNKTHPFFDTTHSKNIFNSMSLINLNSIKEFENKINKKVEDQRFRGNLYVDGIEAWEERDWIGKIIKINNISFKVEKNIPRCVAINLKPKTDDNSINLLKSLKTVYNHFDMGIYLTPLDEGEINIGDKVELNR
tara:strand:+ start:25 stop:804 length:780 start_codon:yes stop_codon:yes gene_type:complete